MYTSMKISIPPKKNMMLLPRKGTLVQRFLPASRSDASNIQRRKRLWRRSCGQKRSILTAEVPLLEWYIYLTSDGKSLLNGSYRMGLMSLSHCCIICLIDMVYLPYLMVVVNRDGIIVSNISGMVSSWDEFSNILGIFT